MIVYTHGPNCQPNKKKICCSWILVWRKLYHKKALKENSFAKHSVKEYLDKVLRFSAKVMISRNPLKHH